MWTKVILVLIIDQLYGNCKASNLGNVDVITELVKRLDEKDAVIRGLVSDYESSVKSLNVKLEQQSEHISDLTRTVEELKLQVEATVHNDKTQNAEGRSTIGAHISFTEPYETQNVKTAERRHMEEDLIAFFATLTPLSTIHLGVGQTIKFDNVITNDGSAYNPHLGAFLTPISGTYLFATTLFSDLGHSTHFYFALNDTLLSRLYVSGHDSGSSSWETASQTIIVYLNKGDVMSVRNVDADEHIAGYNYTTFAGFLIKPGFGNPNTIIGK